MRSTPPDTPRRRLPLALDLPAYGLAAATLAGFAGGWHWLFDLASHFPWYWLLAGLAWFALAARRCSRPATACLLATVAVNEFVFKQPVRVGDILSFFSSITRVGNTSVTVHVAVFAERNPEKLQVVKVTEANLTYVAIDREGKPRPLPRD